MADPRRTLLFLLAGVALGPVPACSFHFAENATVHEPPKTAPTGDFASFPKKPGEVVRKNPDLTAVSKTIEPTEPPPAAVPAVPDEHVVKASDPSTLPAVAIPAAGDPELVAALRAYLENRPNDAFKHLGSLDPANQDFALALLPVLLRVSQQKLPAMSAEEAAVMSEQLQGLLAKLEPRAAMKVEKVSFYKKYDGFGRYEPWPIAQPYKPNDLAHLYFEVKNVASEPAHGPRGETYLTRLSVSLEVRDAKNNLVEQTDFMDWRRRVPVSHFEYAEYSYSPLHDYCRTYRISAPTQPGVYTVTVEVKDAAGNRVARSQPAEFRVAGP